MGTSTDITLADLIDPAAELVQLADGFGFTEGPSFRHGRLIFSDIPRDTRWEWSEAGGLEQVLTPNFRGNGMVFEDDGSYLVCEQDTSVLSRFRADGAREVVASHFEGRELNSPNDVCTRFDGSIWFTDPNYGRWPGPMGVERDPELDFQGVFRVARDGSEIALVVPREEFEQPNGLCFSPDESILYVNDSPRCEIRAFDVLDDGTLGPPRLFFEGLGTTEIASGPDGMKCDALGNIWGSGRDGVWVIDPAGRRLGVVPTPEFPGNLVWGGEDLRSLYITCTSTLQVIRTKVAAAPLPCHR